MASTFARIGEEFGGGWFDEQRALDPSRFERAEDYLYAQSGGRAGRPQQVKTRTARVRDIYQDARFPPDDRSWYRGREAKDFPDVERPALWRRLQELSTDLPYPAPTGVFQPRAGRVYQGRLENFYLVVAMQAVGMKPQLLASIFANMDFSDPNLGVFVLRLYKHGRWQYVDIDDALPFAKDQTPLCSSGEFFPDLAWPSLLEKAYAKLHGSWEGLGGGGHVEEALADLTGGCASRFGTADVAADRLWHYLFEMQRGCVFACNINEAECSKRNVPIDRHWASSIFRVAKHQGVPYVCVCTAAPAMTVRHLPVCDVPSPEGYGIQDGFAWLRIDDFVAFFDTVYECRLVNSDLGPPHQTGLPYTPAWVPGNAWFEEMWAFQGNVYGETAPAFLIDVPDVPNELTLEISQTDARFTDPHEEPVNGRQLQTPLLLRFYQCSPEVSEAGGGEIHLVHLSAWGHCRDACCGVKVLRPGRFLAMVSVPAQYVCHKMIFRVYSSRIVAMKPITQHRSWISVNPAKPLDAIPFSLSGFPRVDAYSERLPQMFDEAEGRGRPLANAQRSGAGGAGGGPWGGSAGSGSGLKVVGAFGGRDAVATVQASEAQAGCSIA